MLATSGRDSAPFIARAREKNREAWSSMPIRERELREHIWEEFNESQLHASLCEIQSEKHRRVVEYRCPDVVTLEHDFAHDVAKHLPPLPGSFALFIGRRETGFIGQLKSAYEARDIAKLKQLGDCFKKEVSAVVPPKRSEAVSCIVGSEVMFDFRYGSRLLAPDLTMSSHLNLGGMHFAWNGGQLDDTKFEIAEHFKLGFASEDSPYEYLVVKRPPALSEHERQVLHSVPEDLSEMHMSNFGACAAVCVAVVLVITFITAVGETCTQIEHELDKLSTDSLDDVRTLGRNATARDLLSARRRVFEKYRS